jgi:hypothetical protein
LFLLFTVGNASQTLIDFLPLSGAFPSYFLIFLSMLLDGAGRFLMQRPEIFPKGHGENGADPWSFRNVVLSAALTDTVSGRFR